MAHFFVPPRNFNGKKFHFDPSESRHLAKVLRKKSGDLIQVFNGEGLIRTAELKEISEAKVTGEITDESPLRDRSAVVASTLELHVWPAVLKGSRFDWLIEKLTELGVKGIHPLLTERTVVKIKPSDASSKIKRWEKIALSAAKQCGRAEFPKIFPPSEWRQAVQSVESGLMLWESEEQKLLAQGLDALKTNTPERISINLFIGPEGGLTVAEADAAITRGIFPVHLGQNILRAETAAIAATAYILLA